MANVALPVQTDGFPQYDFDVDLDGSIFTLNFYWNDRDSRWYMDLFDADGVEIASGITVVANWDLLRKVASENRPAGTLYAIDTTDTGDPGQFDLGTRVKLVYEEA